MMEELQSLTRHVDHIKTIVAMQQSYAGVAGVIEAVALPQLLDDAIKLNFASLAKYNITVVREYEDLPEIRVDKQRVLQILVNLVTNAKDALIESGCRSLRLRRASPSAAKTTITGCRSKSATTVRGSRKRI